MKLKANIGKPLEYLCVNEVSCDPYVKFRFIGLNGYLNIESEYNSKIVLSPIDRFSYPKLISQHTSLFIASSYNETTDKFKITKGANVNQIYKVINLSDPNIWTYNFPIMIHDNTGSNNVMGIEDNTKTNLTITQIDVSNYSYVALIDTFFIHRSFTVTPDKNKSNEQLIYGWSDDSADSWAQAL